MKWFNPQKLKILRYLNYINYLSWFDKRKNDVITNHENIFLSVMALFYHTQTQRVEEVLCRVEGDDSQPAESNLKLPLTNTHLQTIKLVAINSLSHLFSFLFKF